MTFKVVKNAAGHTIAFGPDDDSYEPVIPDGCELTIEESAQLWADPEIQKSDLLVIARANRETLMNRLTWLRTECNEALTAAQAASNAPEAALQTANIAAIKVAINSLVNAFEDPRVVASVNGAAKQAIQLVYAEIVQAFKVAAPGPFARFKKLDAL